MGNTGVIIVGTGATIGLAMLGRYLAKTGGTAGKLDIVLDEFSLGAGSGIGHLGLKIPSVTFKAKLRIKNPTGNALTISQPYVKVFYNNSQNPIGESHTTEKNYQLKAKAETSVIVDVEFPSMSLLQMPDMLKYMLKRAKGSPSTRKVKIEIQVAGNGINKTISQVVPI